MGKNRRGSLAEAVAVVSSGTEYCVAWNGHLDRNGYGITKHNGRNTGAHRALYEIVIGSIPSGLVIDHLCRHRACVNPLHMEPVTIGENIRRGDTGKRGTSHTGPDCRLVRYGKQTRCRPCRAKYEKAWREARAAR